MSMIVIIDNNNNTISVSRFTVIYTVFVPDFNVQLKADYQLTITILSN